MEYCVAMIINYHNIQNISLFHKHVEQKKIVTQDHTPCVFIENTKLVKLIYVLRN